jgi:hypothetical protein
MTRFSTASVVNGRAKPEDKEPLTIAADSGFPTKHWAGTVQLNSQPDKRDQGAGEHTQHRSDHEIASAN